MNQRDYDDPIDALKAELASVSLPPQFQSRVRQRIAGELDLLRDELAAVAPSPEFAARVRQGIDADAAVRGANWLTGWRWLVPAAAVAAIVIAAFVMWRPRSESPAQIIARAPVETSKPPATTQEPPVPSPAPVRVSRADSSKFEVRSSNVGRSTSGSLPPDTRESVGPDLVVLTNQPAVLRAMWAGMENRALGERPDGVVAEVGEIVIAPLEVVPVVVKWLVEPPPPPDVGVLPIIRRISALAAERSLQ